MKERKTKKLLSLILATVMSILLIGSSVFADGTTYTAIAAPTGVKFKKVLIMPAETPVPTAGYTFSIAAGTAFAGDPDNGTYEVKAGITDGTYPKVKNDAIFTSGEAKDGTPDPATTTKYSTSKTKDVEIDFGSITFTEPGVYRYVITESPATNQSTSQPYANTAIKDDTKSILMDVYVKNDDSGNLVLGGTTMYKVAAADQETIKPKTDGTFPDKDANKEKTDKFVNEYPTNTVELKKEVTGNQGSKDEWFKFTVTITAPSTTDTTSKIAITGQTPAPSANAATSYTAADMAAKNGVNELALSAFATGYDLYLQDASDVKLQGIPEGCTVSISEANANKYSVTTKVDGTTKATNVTDDAVSVSATVGTKDILITYTNDKDGTIPTGVIVSVAGLLVVGVIAIIGFVFFGTRSRRRYEED